MQLAKVSSVSTYRTCPSHHTCLPIVACVPLFPVPHLALQTPEETMLYGRCCSSIPGSQWIRDQRPAQVLPGQALADC